MSEFKPLTMSDIRPAAGEGKLSAHDVLNAVNGILRASSLTVPAQQQPKVTPERIMELALQIIHATEGNPKRAYEAASHIAHVFEINVRSSNASVPPHDSASNITPLWVLHDMQASGSWHAPTLKRAIENLEALARSRSQEATAQQSWYCDQCAIEVYQVRCPHCGKTKRAKR